MKMRLWQGILASVAVHAALFQIPIGLSAPREPECVEVQFVLVAAPAPSRAPGPAPIASVAPPLLPQIAVPPPPVVAAVTQRKPVVRFRPERKTPPPKAEPAPPSEEAPPAELEMPLPSSPENEAAEPSPPPVAAPASAPLVAALPASGPGSSASIFGGSGGPGFVKRVLPRYPLLAREMGREGTVMLSLSIDEHGVLQEAQIVEGAGLGFDEEALRAIQASRFRPAVRNGQPIASRALLPVRFVLKGSGDD
jgi:protein TonB